MRDRASKSYLRDWQTQRFRWRRYLADRLSELAQLVLVWEARLRAKARRKTSATS